MEAWTFILIAIAVMALTVVVTALCVREKDRKKLEYMLDAFEDEEYNFRFQENSRYNRTLNRIKWIVERRRQQYEQDSWTKLIRVLTHEIMNTVSPISSLSQALRRDAELPTEERQMDIKAGLETISNSSEDLIRFVKSYRELAGVVKPIKKAVMLDHLVGNVIELTREECLTTNVKLSYTPESDNILIYVDESQISRIFINLIKNAIQAKAHHIMVSATIDRDDATTVRVINDGEPITPESQTQIFIPFFSTKSEGSGIGLSLSRQIMRAHNGTIELTKSDETETEFLLTFK